MKRAVIRLPSEVVERLDRLAAELHAADPALRLSRAAVVRALLATGLRALEADPRPSLLSSLDARAAVRPPGPPKHARKAP